MTDNGKVLVGLGAFVGLMYLAGSRAEAMQPVAGGQTGKGFYQWLQELLSGLVPPPGGGGGGGGTPGTPGQPFTPYVAPVYSAFSGTSPDTGGDAGTSADIGATAESYGAVAGRLSADQERTVNALSAALAAAGPFTGGISTLMGAALKGMFSIGGWIGDKIASYINTVNPVQPTPTVQVAPPGAPPSSGELTEAERASISPVDVTPEGVVGPPAGSLANIGAASSPESTGGPSQDTTNSPGSNERSNETGGDPSSGGNAPGSGDSGPGTGGPGSGDPGSEGSGGGAAGGMGGESW